MISNTILVKEHYDYYIRPNVEFTKHGFMILKNDSHSGRRIRETGILDCQEYITDLAFTIIPRHGIVFDCGSMYGGFTSACDRRLCYDGMVVAIEPGMVAMECLKHNCPPLITRNIFIHRALTESHDTWTRHKVTDDHGSSLVLKDDPTAMNIKTASIDGIVKELCLDRVSFIKMKCQGWECSILKGALQTIEQYFPSMIMEINHSQLQLQGGSFQEIKEILKSNSYTYKIIETNLTEDSPEFNILCQLDLNLNFNYDFVVSV